FRAAAALAPTTVSLLVEHAAAAARQGPEAEALASLRKAAGLDPRNAEARALAAKIHLTRAARRQARGDAKGQSEDLRAAQAAAPELFPPAERARLTAGGVPAGSSAGAPPLSPAGSGRAPLSAPLGGGRTANPKDILTAAQHESFIKNGYLIVKNAVPEAAIAAALARFDAPRAEGGGNAVPPKRAEVPEIGACLTQTVHRAISELLGDAYLYLDLPQRRFRDMPRRPDPGAAYFPPVPHTDNAYPALMPDGFDVGVFIFLTKGTPRSGCFIVFPGSHRRYRLRLANDPGALSAHDNVVDENAEWRETLCEPGDLLLFHHLLGHSQSVNIDNPRTRHALLGWIQADRRIFPGEKPFEAMSTIEKANSTRYLESRFKTAYPRFGGTSSFDSLRDGAPFSRDILTFDLIRRAGVHEFFFVERGSPEVLRRARGADWSEWSVSDALSFPGRAIASVHLYRQADATLLFLTFAGGGTELLRSADLAGWHRIAGLSGRRTAFGHSGIVSEDNRRHSASMIFSARENEPGVLRRLRGQAWAEAEKWSLETVAADVGRGVEILDACAAPVRGDSLFALALDLRRAGSADPPRLHILRSPNGERFEGPPEALAGPGVEAPRALRVYDRARDFWLVAFLRGVSGGEALFLGTVDWSSAAPVLAPIETPQALERALGQVGLR
ncbi:MAG: phytanoyl-CoA dioxygenase family protein, partial [Elusimicrobiota bacterium]